MPIKALCLIQNADRSTIETICGLRRRGCDVRASCPPNLEARKLLAEAKVPLVEFEITKRLDLDGIRQLRAELVSGHYDILHVFGNRGLQNGVIALRGLPTRLVAYRGRVGNVGFLDPFSWLRYLNPRVDRVICVSDAVRDYFLAMRPAFMRARPEKFVRIYKGHDPAWYKAPAADLTALGLPANAFVIACVANYREHKGIDEIVEAMRHLPSDCPAHLVLVGKMDSPKLDRLILSLPEPERVHRIGYRNDAPAIAAASDVFALLTTIPEGLPRSVIEAMATARPCIVTNFGGQSEVVVDGESGLHVPPGDTNAIAAAITQLYRDPGLRHTLGASARMRIATHFNIKQTIDATLAVYRELAA